MCIMYSLDLSVIIPFYNTHLDNLRIALDSVFKQKLTPKIIYIVDDFSPVREELTNFVSDMINLFGVNIKILLNDSNKGPAYSRNAAMKIAETEYIAFLDEDDTWCEDKLMIQINLMKINNHLISFCKYTTSNCDEINNNVKFKIIDSRSLNFKNPISTRTVILNRRIYRTFNFDESLRYAEDYDLWFRISKYCSIASYDFNGAKTYKNQYEKGLSSNILSMYKSERVVIKRYVVNPFYKIFILYFLHPIKLMKRLKEQIC